MLKRAALYQEAELRLKARIIESFLTEVDASVIIDVPGNPLARQMEAITSEYEDSLQQARYAVEDAQEDYADILEAADLAIADDLAGVTLQDRLNAILDGIAKKLDENYSSEEIAAEKGEAKATRLSRAASEDYHSGKRLDLFPLFPNHSLDSLDFRLARHLIDWDPSHLQSTLW